MRKAQAPHKPTSAHGRLKTVLTFTHAVARWKRNFSLLRQLLYHVPPLLSSDFSKKYLFFHISYCFRTVLRKILFCFSFVKKHIPQQSLLKSTKTSPTSARIFSPLYISPKITTKNRTKWIFTKSAFGCIIQFPSEVRSASVLHGFPAQPFCFLRNINLMI